MINMCNYYESQVVVPMHSCKAKVIFHFIMYLFISFRGAKHRTISPRSMLTEINDGGVTNHGNQP